ncbi:MAG: alanine dehydrogenase [Armatimonadota bacterium]
MIIGVPREIKNGENRVAATPGGVHMLVSDGHTVLVEATAGLGSAITDGEYQRAGAEIVATAAEVYERAEMIVKVKEPLPPEYPLLKSNHLLFTYLHLASSEELTRALLGAGLTGVAYETIQTPDGRLPLLAPMSEVAGKMASQVGAWCLEKHQGGRGVLRGGVRGVPPAEVLIIGCGSVGTAAAKVASGMGAKVTVVDINHDRLKYLDDVLPGHVTTLYSTPYSIAEAASTTDLLIGAVLIPGALAPKLVSEDAVKGMKPNSVIVDVAIDQGGCVETIRPTSHSEPIYRLHDVLHYAVPNIPAAVPRTSTFALTNATLPYVRRLAALGVDQAAAQDASLAAGINVRGGEITYAAVKEAFGW